MRTSDRKTNKLPQFINLKEDVLTLKMRIADMNNVDWCDVRLIVNGVEMENSEMVQNYNVTPGCVIDIGIRYKD